MKMYKFVMNYSSGLDYLRTSCVTGKNFVTCVCSVCDSFTLFFIKTFSMDFKASKISLMAFYLHELNFYSDFDFV